MLWWELWCVKCICRARLISDLARTGADSLFPPSSVRLHALGIGPKLFGDVEAWRNRFAPLNNGAHSYFVERSEYEDWSVCLQF